MGVEELVTEAFKEGYKNAIEDIRKSVSSILERMEEKAKNIGVNRDVEKEIQNG